MPITDLDLYRVHPMSMSEEELGTRISLYPLFFPISLLLLYFILYYNCKSFKLIDWGAGSLIFDKNKIFFGQDQDLKAGLSEICESNKI